ncbi:MAG: hypothetical protein QNI90_10775 [Dinoroseobacter sp.]|nr:hypothetical protein [Dinoroseobacter sp.]
MRLIYIFSAIVSVVAGPAVAAGPLEGEKSIRLLEPDGTAHTVGQVLFTPEGETVSYTVTWDEAQFGDHFLSMRPFKCLEGREKYWCQVPYPYDINRQVSADDLTDLEYELMFLWKGATEYGINMWNGVYYRLGVEGDRLVGHLHEIDMEPLGVPPAAGEMRPIRAADLHEADPDSHWLPVLVIE